MHLSLVWLTIAYNYGAHICIHVCVNKTTCHYVHVLQDGQGKVSSNHISLFAAGHESSDWELSNAATQPVANEIVLVINEKQSNTTNDVEQLKILNDQLWISHAQIDEM